MRDGLGKFSTPLKEEIQKLLQTVPLTALHQAYENLSQVYREKREGGTGQGIQTSPFFPLAYLAARAPATLGVLSQVVEEVAPFLQKKEMLTFLDVGAGLGLAAYLMAETFPTLEVLTLIEREPLMREVGKTLLRHVPLKGVTWREDREGDFHGLPPQDLVLLSYFLNEVKATDQEEVLTAAWEKTTGALFLIEAGTPEGFELIRRSRQLLIQKGATILAPCPHSGTCPMTAPNWCHFSVRLSRDRLHRLVKGGTLGYEDEKFSYLVAVPSQETPSMPEEMIPIGQPPLQEGGRVISKPRKRPGHILIDVCTPEEEVKTWTLSRTHPDYGHIKEIQWGQKIREKPKKNGGKPPL